MADDNPKKIKVNITSDDSNDVSSNDDSTQNQTGDDQTQNNNDAQDIAQTSAAMIGGVSYDDLLKKDIIDLMGLSDIPEEEKKKLKDSMMETIQMRLIARVDDLISDQDLPEWKKLLEEGDPEEINPYLEKKGINVNQIMAEETLIYKLEMVKASQGLTKTTPTQTQTD